MSNVTAPAPRPAAVDLDAAIMWCADSMAFRRAVGVEVDDSHLEEWEITVRQLVADLAHTRAERDAAWDELALLHAEADIGSEIACDEMERVTAERDAALAALPDADDLDSIAQALPAGPEQLYQWAIADRIRAAAAAADPVTVPDVPPFLCHRVRRLA